MVFGWLKKLTGREQQSDGSFESYFHSLTQHDDERSFTSAYDKMPHPWRHLVVTRWAYNEIGNGGLSQFFYNSTGVAAQEAVEGLIAIGMPKAAEILKTAIESFGPSYPRDRDVRIEMIKAFPETEMITFINGSYPSAHIRFAELNEEFWGYMETEAGGFEVAAQRYAGPHTLGEI